MECLLSLIMSQTLDLMHEMNNDSTYLEPDINSLDEERLSMYLAYGSC